MFILSNLLNRIKFDFFIHLQTVITVIIILIMSDIEVTTVVVCIKKEELVKRGIKNFLEWKNRPNSVYIGRNMDFYVTGATASKWGNPFTINKYGLDKCLRLYEEYVRNTPSLYDALEELDGKELGCWCKQFVADPVKGKQFVADPVKDKPSVCHGDVLVKLVKEKKQKSKETSSTDVKS